MASDAPWQTLHPLSLAVNLVPRAWATVRSVWPLLLALLYGRATGEGVFDLLLLFVFFGLAVGSTVVHFLTLRYRVADRRLEIRSGLVNRQVRVIAADRVQNLEMVRNVFHRASGLVELRIETASGTEVEGLLSALTVADAQALIDALQAARGEAAPAEPLPAEVVATNGPVELLWYGATGLRLGAVAVLVGFAYEAWVLWDPLDPEDLDRDADPAFTGLFVVAALTGAWLFGLGTALVRHHGFRLSRVGSVLVAEQGLFTRRRGELRSAAWSWRPARRSARARPACRWRRSTSRCSRRRCGA
jgi:putative membrane protein